MGFYFRNGQFSYQILYSYLKKNIYLDILSVNIVLGHVIMKKKERGFMHSIIHHSIPSDVFHHNECCGSICGIADFHSPLFPSGHGLLA